MKIRRFVAATMPEALRQVKEALGADAVILETADADGTVVVTAASDPEEATDGGLLAREVRHLTRLVRELVGERAPVPAEMRALHESLVGLGVDGVIAAALVRELAPQLGPERPVATALAALLGAARPAARVQLFVGPPGDGKTTTLVKLAARRRAAGQQVVMLSADTFRVGGAAELAAYGRALGVSVDRVTTPGDLGPLLARLGTADGVLIDTPGAGPGQPAELDELAALRSAAGPEAACLVVVSATTSHPAAVRTCEAFAALRPDACVLTKLDAGPGAPMLGLCWQQRLAVAHLTAGRRIPDDIVAATPDRLAQCLLAA